MAKESSDNTAKNDLVWDPLGNGEKQETFDGEPRLDDDRYLLPTRRTLAAKARGPNQTYARCGKRLVTTPPPSATRRAEHNTELRRHDRLDKPNLFLDHQSGCSAGGWPAPRKDFRVPVRGLHQRVSKNDKCPGNERHCSEPVSSFGCVTGQRGTSPHHAGDQTVKVKLGQQHYPIRKTWKTSTDLVWSQKKSVGLSPKPQT